MSVAWRSFFVHKSFQISSTLLITLIALPLPCNILFLSWSLRDAHLLRMSPFKFRPPSDRFDLTISPVQHVICLLSVAWRDNQRLLRRLTCYSRKSSSALKWRMARREFTERYLTMMPLMVHYERSTHIILCPVYYLPGRTRVKNKKTKKRRKKLPNREEDPPKSQQPYNESRKTIIVQSERLTLFFS